MKRHILPIIFGLTALAATAVPARRGVVTMTQPDGTEVRVYLMGDEHHHYIISEEGYLAKEVGGFLYYAVADSDGAVTATSYRLTDEVSEDFLETLNREETAERMSTGRQKALSRSKFKKTRSEWTMPGGPGLYPYSDYPTKGEQRSLVILVEFSDVTCKLENPHEYFEGLLNAPGFSEYGATGSARDYFLECSDGQFSPQFDLYGPVKLPNRMAYYGSNDSEGNDRHPAEMIAHACAALDDEVDFSLYDLDGDGSIDNVFVFYAGEGEAAGGSAETVWPHSWYVTAGIDEPQVFDGVVLDRYACSCEWVVSGRKGRPDGVGTFIHEFSHVLGLPDLYPTSYNDAFTPEEWSVLDQGSYNNDGRTPPLYSAFERYALGWLEPFDMSVSASIELNPIGSNEAGIFLCKNEEGEGNPYEYYLVENRQQTGWDTYLPGHGMLVWHIDYDYEDWWNNEVNNTPEHQRVDLIEADGRIFAGKDRAGDSFPGKWKVKSLTDATYPSLRSWAGVPSGIAITDIAEIDGVVRFNLNGGASAPVVEAGSVSWRIDGDRLLVDGLAYDSEVRVYDLTGRVIAQGNADSNGSVSLTLPYTGVYILHTPSGTVKVAWLR